MQQLRIIIYARLSKNRSGLSTNTKIQIAECLDEAKHYARSRHLELVVVDTFDEDDVSASRYSKKLRPKYDRAMALIKANKVDMIWSTEWERLLRRPREMDDLVELAEQVNALELYFTSEDESFNLKTTNGIYRARAAVNSAERESRKISERTRRKEAVRASDGLPHGGHRSFGFDTDGIVIREDEAQVLRIMADKLTGGASYKDIAWWLNAEGYRTAQDKLWYPITVRNTLQRKKYAGLRVHLGAEHPGVWKAIFDEEEWAKIQLTIQTRTDAHGNQPPARKYLLTGLLYCGKCGGRLNGETKRDKPSRPLRPVYTCRTQGDTEKAGGCGGVTRNAVALNAHVRDQVIAQLELGSVPVALQVTRDESRRWMELLAERDRYKSTLNSLLDDYTDGLLSKSEYARAKTRSEAALAAVDDAAHSLQVSGMNVALAAGESVREAWDSNEDGWRRELMSALIERVIVKPGNTKPLVTVDGVQMRFDAKLIEIIWRT